ncbi:hypothetical protein DV735_g4968, partial [Chaetothyriales sp. CBS 134920]
MHPQSSSRETANQPSSSLAPPVFVDNSLVYPRPTYRPGSQPNSRGSSVHSAERRSRPQTPSATWGSDGSLSPAHSPATTHSGPTTPGSAKPIKRKNRFLVKADKSGREKDQQPAAWVAGLANKVPYDLKPLLQDRVPELWNEHGDTLVHLHPRASGRGPSFKLHSSLFVDSEELNMLRFEALTTAHETRAAYHNVQSHMASLSVHPPPSNANGEYRAPGGQWESDSPTLPSINEPRLGEVHIWLPLELDNPVLGPGEEVQGDDLELIVLYRNFFAFLLGGALVATSRQHELYDIFLGISGLLKKYRFGDANGSTWGAIPTASFARYCEELPLSDVRSNRERMIEAIVLGEQMRYWPLYNDGFVHATGILAEIKTSKSAKLGKISPITLNRLERASIDLEARILVLQHKLDKFDFPSMFSGAASSQTSAESKSVSFKAWKEAFFDFQRFVLTFYRRKFGSWPPKASSKKNNFEESGLNRLVVRELYRDFTDLYDMLVDRTSLTTRSDGILPAPRTDASRGIESIQHALRVVESEYDRATPPVAPAIPFDVPIIPAFANSFNRSHVVDLAPRAYSASTVRLKHSDVSAILLGSCNRDQIQASAFIQEFINYERKLGSGKTVDELVDNRCGQWLFMYAVLQSLPMTAVDARDVKFTEGVETFLCVAPRGGRPWMKEDTSQSRSWYNVASGGGYVSLPADLIDHSVEGIYRRSHCWQVATKWVTQGGISPSEEDDDFGPPTPPELSPTAPTGFPTGFLAPSPIAAGSLAVSSAPFYPSPRVSSAPFYPSPRVSSAPFYPSPSASPMLRPQSAFGEGRRCITPRTITPSRSFVDLGLEAAAGPPGKAARPVSVLNPDITFDTILAQVALEAQGKNKKK